MSGFFGGGGSGITGGGGSSGSGGVAYDGTDVTTGPADGDVLAEGYAPLVPTNNNATTFEGFVAGGDIREFVHFGNNGIFESGGPGDLAAMDGWGVQMSFKGSCVWVGGASPSDTSFELFCIGLADYAGFGSFGSSQEGLRDNGDAAAVVIDASGNVKSYDTDTGGDASYTDSGNDVALSSGTTFYFEMVLKNTESGVHTLTITVDGNTILNEVTPAGRAYAPLMLLNSRMVVGPVVYKVGKVA